MGKENDQVEAEAETEVLRLGVVGRQEEEVEVGPIELRINVAPRYASSRTLTIIIKRGPKCVGGEENESYVGFSWLIGAEQHPPNNRGPFPNSRQPEATGVVPW